MNVADLIHVARADGAELVLSGDRLQLCGASAVVERWRPVLAPHKAELLALLREGVQLPPADPYDADTRALWLAARGWPHAEAVALVRREDERLARQAIEHAKRGAGRSGVNPTGLARRIGL